LSPLSKSKLLQWLDEIENSSSCDEALDRLKNVNDQKGCFFE